MALNSINTNLAAYSAQGNIGKASNMASASIARLSSGNRITKASDDVAALSIGTSLRTGVTTLKQALANTAQGSSLLQVADGALAQISEILQRQKAIATQANSGTLSDTERSYLNQEFQSLKSQIDQIATSSSFSSVKLLDGTLSASTTLGTRSDDSGATRVSTAGTIITFANAVPANNDQVTINGVTVTFTTSAVGTTGAAGKVAVGTTVTDTAANLAAYLNGSTDARLANLNFFGNAGSLEASWGGGLLSGAYVVDATVVTAGTPANITAGTAANRTIAVGASEDGLGIDRVRALGSITGNILVPSGIATADAGQALNLRNVEDNEFFRGKFGGDTIGQLMGTWTAAETVAFSLKVGNVTYTTGAVDIVAATATTLTFTGADETGTADGGTFTMIIKGGALTAAEVGDQSDVDAILAQLNDSLSQLDIVQNRDVNTFQEGGNVYLAGVEIANLNGVSANYRGGDFGAIKIESIKITAPGFGETDAKFEVVINGETYVSFSGLGNQINTNKQIALQNVNDSTKSFSIVTGATAVAAGNSLNLDLGTQDKADAIAAALSAAFGLDDAGSKLNFQVGASAADTVGVQIDSVTSSDLYGGATLDVTTLSGAVAAGAVLDSAIATINSVRANVGALQSRLDFTAANLQSSIQNQDAARGTLLDTDVAAESTSYATAQVQLQAGIAVLAQANQIPQNLLKLIS